MRFDPAAVDTRPVLTPEDMRALEEAAFSQGVPSLLLMEHAATAVVDELEKALGGTCAEKRVLFLCGTGNNGGDGLAAARLFAVRGGLPAVWLSGEPKTPDAKTNLQWLQAIRNAQIILTPELPEGQRPYRTDSLDRYDGFVDALLGTGFSGIPGELLCEMMDFVRMRHWRRNRAPVIAVDIPSGIDGKTGKIPGEFLDADVTVTFTAAKPGLYLTPARDQVGKIVVADIGLWPMMDGGEDWLELLRPKLVCEETRPAYLSHMPARSLNDHKGSCGRVLICAGKMGMAGAAAMCAKAAVTAGAGLTTVACEKEIIPILQTLVPNAMCVDIAEAAADPPPYDVLAVGCGLTENDKTWKQLFKLFDPDKPSVWDAGALNLLARHPVELGLNAIITPHPGEAARLLSLPVETVTADRFNAALSLAQRFDCTVVLKGDVSVLCGEGPDSMEYIMNTVGSPALAKGGSGDALTGILAACLCGETFQYNLYNAALACLWHGMAGLVGEEKFGQRELTTDQLISCLHEAEQWGRGQRKAPAGWRG